MPGRPRRPLSIAALIGELRAVSTDPETSPALREQATLRLATGRRRGRQRTAAGRSGDPQSVVGMAELSDASTPVVPPEARYLSGSQLASVLACPGSGFSGGRPRGISSQLGCHLRLRGTRACRAWFEADVDLAALTGHLESVWDQIDFDAKWLSAVERIEAEAALEPSLPGSRTDPTESCSALKSSSACDIDLKSERVRLTGTADRIERESDGRIRIIDFKTGRVRANSQRDCPA